MNIEPIRDTSKRYQEMFIRKYSGYVLAFVKLMKIFKPTKKFQQLYWM